LKELSDELRLLFDAKTQATTPQTPAALVLFGHSKQNNFGCRSIVSKSLVAIASSPLFIRRQCLINQPSNLVDLNSLCRENEVDEEHRFSKCYKEKNKQ
jgi:hypothetical protein